ncbi:uncharacterized protein BBOV_I003210 [Babesia bovis T2Bo]|uniref:Membrane protein, putative n=1 Tax=Babesia bovis TaxID=5865 RepID=A7AWH5_BABBO|nr:uncharacterized protein BBOV_I003210 [Babesia bovis T2Bo]EDO05403.1 putative integral membrane protein [Babesia bovis T2Bo]|eukprot:XP_001608971.1 hypothetical protein [Babesia bovis T2Bo]
MLIWPSLLSALCASIACLGAEGSPGALTLTPAQVLLPSTSFYDVVGGVDPLRVHVQVLLRVEPRVCAVWSVQNPELLNLFSPNNAESLNDFGATSNPALGENCSSTIWAASIRSGPLSSEALRSWVFAFDPSTGSRTGAEVVISPMRSIQFETRNRRIAVNQVATLKIVGHDGFANTFTSLEGIPFEARISDPGIMDIIDIRHEPDVATRARASLLDKRDRFVVGKGYVLTSDVIVLQGRSVGRAKISVRVLLPEYRGIVLEDVEFTVSDSIDLEPSGRVLVPPGVDLKFCVQKIKPQSVIEGVWDSKVDLSQYSWSVSGTHPGVSVRGDGTLRTGKSGGIDYRVILTDKRNMETFSTDVSVRDPASLELSYGSLHPMFECYRSKGCDLGSGLSLDMLSRLHRDIYGRCHGSVRCGSRTLSGPGTVSYLLLGRDYIFDVSMRDKDNSLVYITESIMLQWSVLTSGILEVTPSANGRFALVRASKEGTAEVKVGLDKSSTVHITFKVSVTDPVHLEHFVTDELVPTSVGTGMNTDKPLEPIVGSRVPLVVPLNEPVKLLPRGGSGEYHWHVDNPGLCNVKFGVLRCKSYGSTVLTLSDSLNPENIYKIQVISQKIERLELVPSNVHIESGTSFKLSLVAHADISGIAPVFSKTWDSAAIFYACMPLSCQAGSDATKSNCRVEHDRSILDLVALKHSAFTCGTLEYRALHPGDASVTITVHHELMSAPELSASTAVSVYERLSLQLHSDYSAFPMNTAPQPYMAVQQTGAIPKVLANVAIGSKVRLVVRGGPPMHLDKVNVTGCGGNALKHLHLERVDKSSLDVYCLSETAGERICIGVDNNVRNEYAISCRLPSYIEIHPLVPVNSYGIEDNLKYCSGSPVNWDAHEDISSGVFGSASGLCYKNEGKTKWQVRVNQFGTHAFRAVVYDPFGIPLCPIHNYNLSWRPVAQLPKESGTASYQKIDGSIYIRDYSISTAEDLTVALEWHESMEPKQPTGLSKASVPKSVTALISKSKLWKRSADRKPVYYLDSVLRVIPTLPHEILISADESRDKRVTLFFNPKVRYQFAVVFGSGNYQELGAYSDSIKLHQSGTVHFTSASEFIKQANVMEGVTNVFHPGDVTRLMKDTTVTDIPVRYVNFLCAHPSSRTIEIVDRGVLGQRSRSVLLNVAMVSKLQIVISELPDAKEIPFEGFSELSTPQQGISMLSVKRVYRLHAIAFDSDNNPVSYPSLVGLTFSVCSSGLVKLVHPRDLGYSVNGSAMAIQCLAEGRYTVRAEIRNFGTGNSDSDRSLVTESLEITAYKETKPILSRILMLPNSGEFALSMLDSAIATSFPSYKAALESSNEGILSVQGQGKLGVIRSHAIGSCTLTSYIPSGSMSPVKSMTPVIVALPHSLSISGSNHVRAGSTSLLYARLHDSSGRIFTPVFLMGSSKASSRSHCTFTWFVSGQGVFIENGERSSSVSGVGLGRVTLLLTSPGAVYVTLRASCYHLGTKPQVDLVAPKLQIESFKPLDIFGTGTTQPVTLCPNGFYQSLGGVVDPVASSGAGLLTVDGASIHTENKTGDVLLKTSDNHVTHVQVRDIAQLHIGSNLGSTDISVFKSGRKDLNIELKTNDGASVLCPSDLKLKYMLSDASLFRVVSITGSVVSVVANTIDGCSSLSLFLDEHDQQFDGANLVHDTVRLCVVNALTPQELSVVRGSTVRYLAGYGRGFGISLDGNGLKRRYGLPTGSDIRKFQDAIIAKSDAIHGDIRADLVRALANVLTDMGATQEEGCDSLQILPGRIEAVQYPDGLSLKVVIPFSICRDVDSLVFCSKMTALLQEYGRSAGSIFSLLQGPLFPVDVPGPDDSHWSVDNPELVSIQGSNAVALDVGTAVVKYDSSAMKGDARLHIFNNITSVEYQMYGKSSSGAPFVSMLAHKEFNEPFYIGFKCISPSGNAIEATSQVDPQVLAVCSLVAGDPWVKQVFVSEPVYTRFDGHYTGCFITLREPADQNEWTSLSTALKNASESVSDVRLEVALYSTVSSGRKAGQTPGNATQPLHVALRKVDIALWQRSFKWRLPVFVKFADANGVGQEQVSLEPGKSMLLMVYPYYSRCKLVVSGSSHYKARIQQCQGLLCTLLIDNDGVVEGCKVSVVCQRATAGTLVISSGERSGTVVATVAKTTGHVTDFILLLFTACFAAGFVYLIYAFSHRPNSRFYESTEPIKLERRMPNVFEKLYQSDYHGGPASSTTKYYQRRKL